MNENADPTPNAMQKKHKTALKENRYSTPSFEDVLLLAKISLACRADVQDVRERIQVVEINDHLREANICAAPEV